MMARAGKQAAEAIEPEPGPLREVLSAAVRDVRELRGQLDALRAELKLALQEVAELRRSTRPTDPTPPPAAAPPTESGVRRSDEARRKVRDVLNQMSDIHESAARTDPPPIG
jgi:hypothetical protein